MDVAVLAILLIFGIPIAAIVLNSPPIKALGKVIEAFAMRIAGRSPADPALLQRLEVLEKKLELRERAEALARRVTAEETEKLQRQLLPGEGTVTILVSDIEGFTRFVERGDDVAYEILQIHNRIVRERLPRYGGVEVKSLGDGFLLAFSSARRALLFAMEVQQAFQIYNAEHEEPIRVRMGLDAGEPLRNGEDFIGRTVNLATRIADQARGGEVWVSETVKNLIGTLPGLQFLDRGVRRLEGFSEPQHLYEVARIEALESPERRELEERIRQLEESVRRELEGD